MADLAQLEAALVKADAAGDTEGARILAGAVRQARSGAAPQQTQPFVPSGEKSVGPELLGRAGRALSAAAGMTPIGGGLTKAANLGFEELSKQAYRAGGAATDKAMEMGASPEVAANVGRAANIGVEMIPQALGMGASRLGDVATRAVRSLRPGVELLAKEGVPMTPGQLTGGAMQRIEDSATSIPLVGDIIKGAQRRGIEQFDTAGFNRALNPIGAKLPPGLTGNKAVEYTYGKLGDAYDSLLPKLKGTIDAPLQKEFIDLNNVAQSLPEPQRGQFARILQREVVGRFTPEGAASGESLKRIEERLGGMSKNFKQSDNYDIRILGEHLDETRDALRRMIDRNNPDYQGELSKINEGYANFKRLQKAASGVGTQEGVFTPAQLHRAVRAADASKDKARFAEGNALMQDLSSAGKAVLPSSVPDSGTPIRAAIMYTLAHPVKAIGAGLPALGAASLAYSPVGQKLAQKIMLMPGLTDAERQGLMQAVLASQQGPNR